MQLLEVLIYIHAGLGGIALLAGFVAATTKKGSKIHKKTGALFHNTMVVSIIVSLVVAISPDRFNPFLFGIGIFSLYAVLTGKRILKVNRRDYNLKIDKVLAYLLIINCTLMICLPLILRGKLNIILTVLGALGLLGGIVDLIAFKNIEKLKLDRMKHHINKISGGYIAAVTAFLVVNQLLPGYWAWFTPTVIGSIYAAYHNRKLQQKFIKS